jgi:cbb3-type cytochrome oxidase subunit 3
MWAIFVLGLLFVAVRMWVGRAAERRHAAHEERMARLLEEREAALQREQEPRSPESLAATTSDAAGVGASPAPSEAGTPGFETVKIRCRACRALNDEHATSCVQCGVEL